MNPLPSSPPIRLKIGIVFDLYCCFIQNIWLESGLMRNLSYEKFSDLAFSFQFSYRFVIFFIFYCIIFNFFFTIFFLFQIADAFLDQNMPFGTHKVGFVYILSEYSMKMNPFQTKSYFKKSRCLKNFLHLYKLMKNLR